METTKTYRYAPISKSKKEGFKLVKVSATATEEVVLKFENDLHYYCMVSSDKKLVYYKKMNWI